MIGRSVRRAHLVQLFFRAITFVRFALLQKLISELRVACVPVGLIKRSFVAVQAQPGHAVQNRLDRLIGRALAVGVLDSQHKTAAQFAGIEPAK